MIDNAIIAMLGGKLGDPTKPASKKVEPKIVDSLKSNSAARVQSNQGEYHDFEKVLDFLGSGQNPFDKITASDGSDRGTRASAFIAGRNNPATRKLLDAIVIHNQKNPNASEEERIQSFFDTVHNDSQVQEYVDHFKSRGQGPIAAYRSYRKVAPMNSALRGMLANQ
jgi:hypothetical protein